MRFIYTLEEKKFKEEKEKENELLRSFGVDEETIQSIYEYDKEMFNKNRSYCNHEVHLDDIYFKLLQNPNISLVVYNIHPFEQQMILHTVFLNYTQLVLLLILIN